MGDLELGELLIGLLGGLAIFLFGLEQMTDALRSVAGAGMSAVLGKLTKNRFTAAVTGAFVTSVIQSSSVTTVLVVGFVSAGLMSLQQSVGVIMGANIGTTVTAQIIAFKITEYALLLVAAGFFTSFFVRHKQWKLYGTMVMGLGLIFAGMGLMSEATTPLRTYEPFIDSMQRMGNPLLAILAAAAFTALVQSSSATTGIVIVLASQGFITLEAGIALSFGANVGTCVTAVLAAMGKPTEARRAAAVHLVFNVFGVVIWLPLIGVLASAVVAVSPAHPELEGTARLAAETPRQIANAHTVFNVANTCIFIWLTGPLAALVTKVLPERPVRLPERARPKFLQDAYLDTPGLALDAVRRETARLGDHVLTLASVSRTTVVAGTRWELDAVSSMARDNQRLYDALNEYIRRLSAAELTAVESRRLAALTSIASYVQNISETISVNLISIGRERDKASVRFSDQTVERIHALSSRVRASFELALRSLDEPGLARDVIDMKSEIQKLVSQSVEHLAERLVADDPHRALLYRLESQAVELIQREYYFAKKIAKAVVHEAESNGDEPDETDRHLGD